MSKKTAEEIQLSTYHYVEGMRPLNFANLHDLGWEEDVWFPVEVADKTGVHVKFPHSEVLVYILNEQVSARQTVEIEAEEQIEQPDFESTVPPLLDRIKAQAKSGLINKSNVDDITQDVMLTAQKNWKKYNPAQVSPSTWIAQITRRLIKADNDKQIEIQ